MPQPGAAAWRRDEVTSPPPQKHFGPSPSRPARPVPANPAERPFRRNRAGRRLIDMGHASVAHTAARPGAVRSYALVTPARDEGPNLRRLAACLTAQTVLPLAWVVVDDGSEDDTAAYVESLA